ncbi:MAG: hypothetical protein AAF514_11485 [Verrucomicrobiota bacterium]
MSLVLSLESSGFDGSVQSFWTAHDYNGGGLDAIVEDGSRTEVRNGFSFFSGYPASRSPGSIGDRRRVVIINGLTDSSSHQPWEILFNDSTYRSNQAEDVQALIDSVMPGGGSGGGNDFAAWSADQSFPDGLSGPNDDADRDGSANLQEFFAGTDPLFADGQSIQIQPMDGAFGLSYRMANGLAGVTGRLASSSDLVEWTPLDSENITMVEGEATTEVTVVVESGEPIRFFRLEVMLE